MANETTALDILQRQVESLTAQLEKITGERDEYRDSIKILGAERDELQSQVSSPDAQAARIAKLEASIRDRNHFDKFAELAKGAEGQGQGAAAALAGRQGPRLQARVRRRRRKGPSGRRGELKSEVDYAFDPEPADDDQGRPGGRQGHEPHQVWAGCR